jgi:hypothetical protein
MIETTTARWEYDGDGANDEFDYTNRIDDSAWLKVYVGCVLLVLDTDYTVSGVGEDNGGVVTISVPPAVGDGNVVIIRETPQTQLVNLPTEGPLNSYVLERTIADRLEMQIQDIHEILGRCLKFTECSIYRDIDVPDPEANKILRWNSSADGLENAVIGGLGITNIIIQQPILAGEFEATITHNLSSSSAKLIGFAPTWQTGFKIVSQTANTILIEFSAECPVGGGQVTTEVAL